MATASDCTKTECTMSGTDSQLHRVGANEWSRQTVVIHLGVRLQGQGVWGSVATNAYVHVKIFDHLDPSPRTA